MRIAPDLPIVAGDSDQMAQVLQNLLDNAVKYGRDGGVLSVDAGIAPPGGPLAGAARVVIAVSDQGAGIAREHLPRLTERFYRVDKGRSAPSAAPGFWVGDREAHRQQAPRPDADRERSGPGHHGQCLASGSAGTSAAGGWGLSGPGIMPANVLRPGPPRARRATAAW